MTKRTLEERAVSRYKNSRYKNSNAVITDVIYHGVYRGTRWYSSRPVLTSAFVSHYTPQYLRIGGA